MLRTLRTAPAATLLALAACSGSPAPDPGPEPAADPDAAPPVVQPGAPGEETRAVDPEKVVGMGELGYTAADVRFMQGMIPHHAQALEMTALVPERTSDEGFRRMALRIEISQRDEIELMTRWLEARNEEVPALHAHHHGGPLMAGMLTPEQMDELRAAEGEAFERLFLEYMIMHHRGALLMVDRLFNAPGAGQETELFRFASDVDADQDMEIRRMQEMLEARRP